MRHPCDWPAGTTKESPHGDQIGDRRVRHEENHALDLPELVAIFDGHNLCALASTVRSELVLHFGKRVFRITQKVVALVAAMSEDSFDEFRFGHRGPEDRLSRLLILGRFFRLRKVPEGE